MNRIVLIGNGFDLAQRNRFGLKESSAGSVSRLIKEAVEQKRIKAIDPETAKRYMRYVPIWA